MFNFDCILAGVYTVFILIDKIRFKNCRFNPDPDKMLMQIHSVYTVVDRGGGGVCNWSYYLSQLHHFCIFRKVF